MKNLQKLTFSENGIKELPSSIGNISGLRDLYFSSCKNLTHLPVSILQLRHLETLSLEECPLFTGFGEKVMEDNRQFMASIVPNREYDISGSPPKNSSISNDDCYKIAAVRASEFLSPENLVLLESNRFTHSTWLPNLSKLVLERTSIVSLPASIKSFNRLRYLHLKNCEQIQVPDLPQSIEEVFATGCISLKSVPQVSKKFQFDKSDDSLDTLTWLDLLGCDKMLKKLMNPVFSPLLRMDLIGEIPTSLLEDYVSDGIADSRRGLPTWFSHGNANRCRISVNWQECLEEAITIVLCAVIVFRLPLTMTEVKVFSASASVVREGRSPRHVEGTSVVIGSKSMRSWPHLFWAYTTVEPSELKGNHLEVEFSASPKYGEKIEIASCEVHRVDEHKERAEARKRKNENKERGRANDARGVLNGGTGDVLQMDISNAEPENLLDLLSMIQLHEQRPKFRYPQK